MPAGRADKAAVRTAFDDAYLRQYGHANPEARIEIVTIRVMGIGRLDRPVMVTPRNGEAAPARRRKVHFDGKPVTTAIVDRAGIKRGAGVRGPAIVEEPTATTIIPPGWRVALAAGGHMLITRGRR